MAARVSQIRKRDGSVVAFDSSRIQRAVQKALAATGNEDRDLASALAQRVVGDVEDRFVGLTPGVEDVQDIVERVLMVVGYADVAKACILYRQQRTEMRRLKNAIGVHDVLKLGVNAVKVLERRYLLRDEEGRIVETPAQLFRRVARAVASAETRFDAQADVNGRGYS